MKNPDGSWEAFDDYVLDFAIESMRAGQRTALVTLVRIEGSSPRFVGAQMAVAETGEWVGYLSGGCVERAVIAEALEAIAAGENRVVRYGRGSQYIDIQLPCGSAIELFFDVHLDEAKLIAIDEQLRRRMPASLDIAYREGRQDDVLHRHYQPRKRLIIAGAGPATVQLARMADIAGFDVQLWSHDQATLDRLASRGMRLVSLTGMKNFPRMEADERTAVVLMFHDHDWEMALLPVVLETNAFYIGAMGSRATHRARVRQLQERGISPDDIARINGPAGLFSGSKSAGDIALSILAEIAHIGQARSTAEGDRPESALSRRQLVTSGH